MEYKEIVVVTGEPGLFQLVSSKSDGAILRTLDGQTTKFVPSRNHQFTPLESIEVFTTAENVSLMEVFRTMLAQEADTPVIEANKDAKDIKGYFDKVYPNLDGSRVYMSDMKKMLKWYPLLKKHALISEEAAEDTEAAPETPETPLPEAPNPSAKTAASAAEKQPDHPAGKKKSAPKETKTPKSKSEAAAGKATTQTAQTVKKKAPAKKPKASSGKQAD